MTEQKMREAVQYVNAGCGGAFFYAVKTTGIFCRPSCRSKLPKRENLCYFASGEEARTAGARPANISALSRCFKQHTGQTPTEYRKEHCAP